jgi:predicted RecA/RadA family phage recombinase
MPTTQIANPEGAFGLDKFSGLDYELYESAETSTQIDKGMVVSIDTAGKILKATTTVEPRLVIGVALEDIPAGEVGPIATRGVVKSVKAEGAIAANALVQRSGTTAGSVATFTSVATAIGQVTGVAIAAAASSLVDVYVQKM